MKKNQKQLLLLLIGTSLAYYFLIYLLREREETKKAEENRSQTSNKSPEELQAKLEEDAKLKGRIWDLPAHSWADKEVKKIASTLIKKYQEDASIFPDGDRNKNFYFSRSASYNIHFSPSLQEYYEKGKETDQDNCFMLKSKEELILSKTIENWIKRVKINPTRGQIDANKKDNSALFYGAPGTGKTRTIQNICYETDKYPLVEIKGSALTPTKEDQDSKLLPLKKFCYTISEIEWTLAETYGFEREENGEVRYILFVDEADQISNNALTHDPTKLRFLKECLEGVDQSARSNNLWVFATNHLEDVESAVYREGRLSNPLDFSWTWGEFKKYAEQHGIYEQLPKRWQETNFLNPEENKWVKRFNTKLFQKEFLGDDEDDFEKREFWDLFITNNPDAKYIPDDDQEENEEQTSNNNDENEEELQNIEIGEFLEFFWNLYDSGDLMNYDGKFKSPKTPKVEEVLTISFNALLISLNNMKEEIEKMRTEKNDQIKADISDIYKSLAELRTKVDK